MHYHKIYNQIIEKRKLEEPKDGYTEVHHIVPRSLGGGDNKENLVKLTAREHFICHYLLAKMYNKESLEWYKMNHAFMMMKCQSVTHDRYFNSRLYASLKGNFSSVMSFVQSGSKNSNYGKIWISHINDKVSKLIKSDSIIPDGWIPGRNKWKKKIRKNVKSRAGQKGAPYSLLSVKKRADDLYNKFISSEMSITQFSKSEECDISQPALTKLFKKYIPNYTP